MSTRLQPAELEPKHPSGRALTEFERRLCRLALIVHEAHLLHCSALKSDERQKDSWLMFTLQHYALILLCRFLEIWGQFQALGKDNAQIRDLCRSMSIYIDRINIWPGLQDFRDWIIAHKYQMDRHPEFVPPWRVIGSGRVPSQAAEWILLLECARFAATGVLAYYGDVVRSLAPVLEPGDEPPITQGVKDGTEAEIERRKLAADGNARLQKLRVNLKDPIFSKFKCPPPASA